MVDSGSLVAAVNHAIGALGIAGLGAIVCPFRGVHQLLKRVGIPVLKQITGLLPAEDVVSGHSPGRAGIGALAHQELEEKRRLIELPALFAVGKDCAEQASCARTSQKVLLVRRLVVGVAG